MPISNMTRTMIIRILHTENSAKNAFLCQYFSSLNLSKTICSYHRNVYYKQYFHIQVLGFDPYLTQKSLSTLELVDVSLKSMNAPPEVRAQYQKNLAILVRLTSVILVLTLILT